MARDSDIQFGIFTLNDFTKVIEANLYIAEKLDITIRYHVDSDKALTCELHRYGNIIFKQQYKGRFMHTRLANMHSHILDVLHTIENTERAERERKAKEKAEQERLDRMPNWQDRYRR